MNLTTKTLYVVSVLVMWVPLAFVVRRTSRGSVVQTVVGSLLMAVAWPFAMPVLSSITMSRRERSVAQLVRGGSVLPATNRSSTGTDASSAAGWDPRVSGSRRTRRRPRSPIIAPAENAMPRSALSAS